MTAAISVSNLQIFVRAPNSGILASEFKCQALKEESISVHLSLTNDVPECALKRHGACERVA